MIQYSFKVSQTPNLDASNMHSCDQTRKDQSNFFNFENAYTVKPV